MRKTTKLLAVVMWIGAGQASADPITEAVEAAKAEVTRTHYYQDAAITAFATSMPRVLMTGAPACGNTMSKYVEPCTVEVADREQKERIAEVARTVTEAAQADAQLRKASTALAVAKVRASVVAAIRTARRISGDA